MTFDLGTYGTLLSGDLSQNVVSGGTAIAPEFSVTDGYAFVGWDKSYHDVTSDLTVIAQYADESLVSILEDKVLAGDGAAFDEFGDSVSVNGDIAVVGAYKDDVNGTDSGSAYVFVRNNGVWVEESRLVASDGAPGDRFGQSVSVSGDTVLVGASDDDDRGTNTGSAYVFVRNGDGVWTEQAKLIGSAVGSGRFGDRFGQSVSVHGDTAVVGAFVGRSRRAVGTIIRRGSAYVFVRNNGVWTEQSNLLALVDNEESNNGFGARVSVSNDTAIVGVSYDDDNGTDSGSAYVFVRNNGVWTKQSKLLASDGAAGDRFGMGVSVSGSTLLVGANAGSAYVFVHNNGVWVEESKLVASDIVDPDLSAFGFRVSLSGDTALVGADKDAGGSAYLFERSNGVWTERLKLVASDSEPLDSFGFSVSLSGDTALVGARFDDDNGDDSGSAYFYDLGVAPVNEPPVPMPDTATTNEDEAVTIDVLANDSDANPGDTLSIASVADETNGTAFINPDNTVTFTPDANFNGTASFTYIAQDNNSALSASATVTITVNPVSDQPDALNASFQTDQGTSLSGNLSGSDVDGDAITFQLVSTPSNGAVVLNTDGSFTYTPEPSFAGGVSFTYRVNDGSLDSATATVTIEVTLIPDVSLNIMHPQDGMTVENVRPALMAPFTANFDIRESNFRVYLNDVDYSADVMIEGDKAAFLPFFDLPEGNNTYRIELVLGDTVLASTTTTFTIDSVLPNPTDTQFTGQVQSLEGVPIQGVIVHSGVQSATTDANGQFSFTDLPHGNNLFEFDPSNAADGKLYTPVNLSFEVRPGRKTVWERPVFLAEYDPADGVNVVSNSLTDQVIENPNLPGVKVIIPAGTEIDFPDGSTSGVVTIVDIPVAQSPNCLGAGLRPSRLISLQPENTRLSQPAQLIFPNDLNLPEGTGFDLMSLNIETGIFGKIGRSSVVNGEVVTDAGSGLRTFDWHGDIPETPEINEVDAETNDTKEAYEENTCSTMITRTGELMEDHSTPSYYSLGASRAVGLHYSSLIAAPEFLVNAELARSIRMAEPNALSLVTSTPVGSAQSFFTPSDLALNSSASAARSMDASGLTTGEYELITRVTGRFTSIDGTDFLNSRTRKTSVDIFNGRDLYSSLGTGWSISNVSRLLFDGDGDVTILSGRGRTTRFEEGGIASDENGEEVSIDNLGFELGLAGTGLSGNDGVFDDPRRIVSNLGFIRPTEGEQMLLLQNTDENGLELDGTLAISIPLQRKPFGANSLVFDLDLLADKLIENGFEALTITLNYRGTSDSLYSLTDFKSSFGDIYGDIVGSSQFSTVLAGGDSGYASRSGFRTIGVDLGNVPVGAPMCLRIELTGVLVVDEYGPVSELGRAAALIDNLRYNYIPGSRDISFDRSYASEAGDYSSLVFDSTSGVYTRLFQNGTLQKFNSDGLEISLTDRLGNETRYEYTDGDGDGESDELARVIDPVGLETELTYQNGKLYRIIDPAGRVTEMTYDTNGHLLQILNPDGTTRSFTYDDKGRLLSQTDGESNQRFYTYQPGSSRLASVTRADGQVYEYAPQQTLGLPTENTGSELAPAALYQSGSLGKSTVSTDARGIQTSKTLDENGQPTQVVDNLGNQISMDYDSNRNRTQVTVANGEEFNFTYDAFGNMTRTVRDYDGATTEIEYNTALFDLPTQVTDPLDRVYSFEYDTLGNLIRTTDPLTQTTEFTYNAAGQVLTATDKLGQVSTYAYDSLGRLVSITDELNRTVTYGYDAAGNQTTVTDPQGRVTTTVYDNAGDPMQVTAPDGGVTQFIYDGNKNLIQLIDSLGRTKIWTYDARERVTSYTDALGKQTFMTYDEVGNMITYTREDGTLIEYIYDDVNRVSEVRYPALTGVAADTVSYTYDELYRVTNQSDSDSSIDYVFDPISRLTSTTQTWNSQADTLSFGYDLVDRRVSMTDATGTTTYTYDDLDRLTDLTDSANRAFGFAYDPLDRLTRKTMANGTATDFTYDAASQLLDIITEKVGTSEIIESIAYTYNTTGTRSGETRLDGNVRTFFYDANDRVTQVINSQLPAQNELFAYDLMGNWTTDSRQHNAENELTQDSGYTYSYDSLGNMTVRQSLSNPADRTTYTWDARNLLIAVNGPVNDTSYAYDARNRRVAKTVDSVTTQYVHDGLNVLLEYDGAGNLLARNTHAGLDQLCVRDEVSASTPYYVCQDGISSVLSVSDDNGNILQRYRYSAFGEQQVLDANFNPVADAPLLPFAYTGREWEPEVGMYFYRARFYDPELGRFISRDPLGLSNSDINLYAYVGNNPFNLTDPLGLDWLDTAANFSAGFGDAISFGLTRKFRDSLSFYDGTVDYSSSSYAGGEIAGTVAGMATGGGAGLKIGAKIAGSSGGKILARLSGSGQGASGTAFSHFIPRRIFKRLGVTEGKGILGIFERSALNGNIVNNLRHLRHDATNLKYFGRFYGDLAPDKALPFLMRALDRFPRSLLGGLLGASPHGISAGLSDCN